LDHSPQQTRERFSGFITTLSSVGLRQAMAELLALTDYRFIAIFRYRGDRANAAVFYDREQPDVLTLDEAPAIATYCGIVRESRVPFMTADALDDPRLDEHLARERVQSYFGVPIMTPEGEVLATLCHYDLQPRDPAQVDFELVCEIASALEQGHHVPPYPA
jgi:GAF domain-containing protein